MTTPTIPTPLSREHIAQGTAAAALVAAVVLVTAVLPAEYGVDPTGIGAAAGFLKLGATAPEPPVDANPVDDGTRLAFEESATFRLIEGDIGEFSGNLRPLTTERVRVPLDIANLTKVTARLEWADDSSGSAPDVFEVGVRAPDGRSSQLVSAPNGADGRGNVSAELAWRSVPYPARGADGRLVFPPSAPDASGAGEWTIVVRLYQAGAHADGSEDAGNDWSLTVTVESFEVTTRADASIGAGADAATIVLDPGDDLEYKFAMEAGARLEYRWSSTRPVYWDFHGDTEENPDEFTQYEEDTSEGASGVLEAPFAGRHGWYWRNDGAEPLSITLETRGDYEILGAV